MGTIILYIKCHVSHIIWVSPIQYVKFEFNGIRHHCIRKTIVNGDSLPVYLIIQIIFPDVFLINIANKVISLTFNTATG